MTECTHVSRRANVLFKSVHSKCRRCVAPPMSCLLNTPAQTKPAFSLGSKLFANTQIQIFGRTRKIYFDKDTTQTRNWSNLNKETEVPGELGMKGGKSEVK